MPQIGFTEDREIPALQRLHGHLVILDPGSQTFSLYGDLLGLTVRKGERVTHGHPVGSIGPTPSGTNGLYFELRVDGQPVDPLQWLKKR